MSEYTPDDEDVEVYFALGLCEYRVGNGGVSIAKAHDAYRAWLAAHDLELREQIAREIEAKREKMVEAAIAVTGGLPTWLDPYTEGMDDALAAVRGKEQTND